MTIQENIQLSHILWYHLGGTAKYFLKTHNEQDIIKALDFIEKHHITNTFICGLGSNLIFSDNDFDGAIIQIVADPNAQKQIQAKEGRVEAFAGQTLDDLIQTSFDNNLTGLEWAGGLPGTIGAGVRGNVGAFGGEIKDNLLEAKTLDKTNSNLTIKITTKQDLNFSYRHSLIKENKNLICISATFQLHPSTNKEGEAAREMYHKNITYRQTHHPMDYPTCGSVFKNISEPQNVQKILTRWPDIKETVQTKWHGKVSMGYIINRLGLTGYRVGNMQISEKHANFIINLGDAKSRDVITIINEIKHKVTETLDFTPEVEVEIVD
jgi:UDP-N-acetylmuramate dehydrogenase